MKRQPRDKLPRLLPRGGRLETRHVATSHETRPRLLPRGGPLETRHVATAETLLMHTSRGQSTIFCSGNSSTGYPK